MKRLVDWMLPKMEAFDVLKLVNYSEPARVEEYTTRITGGLGGDLAKPDTEPDTDEDAQAAKRDALIGIGHCIFS